MKTTAFIPCRMGSKRMPRKNMMEIEPGLTLAQHAYNCARYSGVIDRVIVLTDEQPASDATGEIVIPPSEYTSDTCDISSLVAWAARVYCKPGELVATLQPAVLARSPLIVRHVVEAVANSGARGAVTAARTVPWQWTVNEGDAENAWYPGPYPRSQDAAHHLCEINAVQVTRQEVAVSGERWDMPLILAELPEWCAALDIDTPEDFARARDLWPWARTRLETWEPPMHLAQSINGWVARVPKVSA